MAGSVQGSAIDDNFETLTNAPDAWLSGRNTAPPPVDRQFFVDPGDERSAIDDRCFTEYGGPAAQYSYNPHPDQHPTKTDQTRRQSHRSTSKPPTRGKRRPSPNFVIRGKNGETFVRSNPFILRKPSRARSKDAPGSRSEDYTQTEHDKQSSPTKALRSPRYGLLIKGKHGEEAVQEIRRPLFFASESGDAFDSRDSTVFVEDSSSTENYYPTRSSSRHGQRRKTSRPNSESGLVTFTDFVSDSKSPSIDMSSTVKNSVKMSGALPLYSTPPRSSKSSPLPPAKPPSSAHDSAIDMNDALDPFKEPSQTSQHSARSKSSQQSSHPSATSSKRSSHSLSHKQLMIIPDDSAEGLAAELKSSTSSPSEARSTSSSSLHLSEVPSVLGLAPSSKSSTSERHPSGSGSQKSSSSSSRVSSHWSLPRTSPSRHSNIASQHLEHGQQESEQPSSLILTLSKVDNTNHGGYYSWRAPDDSLYSTSNENVAFSSCSGGVPLREIASQESSAHTSSEASIKTSKTRPSRQQPPTLSVSAAVSASALASASTEGSRRSETTWLQEKGRSKKSHSSSQESRKSHSSSRHSKRSSGGSLSRKGQEPWEWKEPSWPSKSGRKSSSRQHSSRSRSRSRGERSEHTDWKPSSWFSRLEKASQASRSRSRVSQSSRVSDRHSREEPDRSHGKWTSPKEESSQPSSRPGTSIRVEEELFQYLPSLSSDTPLPPPMPILETIHEEAEPAVLATHISSTLTHESTHYARPGVISPHPLSSVSSALVARQPPLVEAWQAKYVAPFVESASDTNSASSTTASHGRKSSRPRALEVGSFHSTDEERYQGTSGRSLLRGALEARRRRTLERAASGSETWDRI